MTYNFHRGETIVVALDAVSGDVAIVSEATAKIRRLNARRDGFATGAAASAMTVSPRPASGDVPAGWDISMSGAATANLAPGHYGIEAQLIVGGGVIKTDFAPVRMLDAA